jgi:hypothetical protein
MTEVDAKIEIRFMTVLYSFVIVGIEGLMKIVELSGFRSDSLLFRYPI